MFREKLDSSVIIVGGHKDVADQISARWYPCGLSLLSEENQMSVSVAVLPPEDPHLELAWNRLESEAAGVQIILVSCEQKLLSLEILSRRRAFAILLLPTTQELNAAIGRAQVSYLEVQQKEELHRTLTSENENLSKTRKELEERVSKRQKYLEATQTKLQRSNQKLNTLKEALSIIQRARSIAELEIELRNLLHQSYGVAALRIIFSPEGLLSSRTSLVGSAEAIRHSFSNEFLSGEVVYIRDSGAFLSSQRDLLEELSEAVAIAVTRLIQIERYETLTAQWQATFNSVSKPLALIRPDYEVVLANQAFDKSGDGGQRKCYEILFGRTEPCADCHLGSNFSLQMTNVGRTSYFSVESHALAQEDDWLGRVYVNFYDDMTEQKLLERRILESAQLAELGLIGSSIAHELNNPIGGMLSFAQLIKMDLDSKDKLLAEINEIERGILRCKSIVENLLGFSRRPSQEELAPQSLLDVWDATCGLLESQLRLQAVEVRLDRLLLKNIVVRMHLGLMVQAFTHVLQGLLELVQRIDVREKRWISLNIKDTRETVFVYIEIPTAPTDDGTLIGGTSLNKLVPRQILRSHGGDLDFKRLDETRIQAILTLPINLAPAESRVFDR